MLNAQHSSAKDDWRTPPDVVAASKAVLGGKIDFDPASDVEANKHIGAGRYMTREQDALATPWGEDLGSVFLNPPGGRLSGAWTRSKTLAFWERLMHYRYAMDHAVFVGFNMEILQYSQGHSFLPALSFPFCVPSRRIRFLHPETGEGSAPNHGNVIVYVPGKLDCTGIFFDVFGWFGACCRGGR